MRSGTAVGVLITLLLPSSLWAGGDQDAFVAATRAQEEIPEEELLDVGIQVFSPGLPAEDPDALEEKGVYEDVRKSEARFIPVHLMRTLQSTGFWGAVRVLPPSGWADVTVSGEILDSSGRVLQLQVRASDSSGRPWLDKRYKRIASTDAYDEDRDELAKPDPYESLYNEIANDLLESYRPLSPEEIAALREISELRFASELLPDAFDGYLKVNKKGRYSVVRLPAEGDPMLARITRIRERDYMFVDTLNEYYSTFYAQMEQPYDDWRSFSYEEQVALRKLRREARMEKILGAIAIIGGATISGSSSAGRAARTAATIGGAIALQDGMQKGKESKIHSESLKELAQSFDAEVAPLLVDVEGQTLRLTGSVEDQYTSWRSLLRQLFASETGLPIDPNTGAVQVDADPIPRDQATHEAATPNHRP